MILRMLFKIVVDGDLSVRETEKLVKNYHSIDNPEKNKEDNKESAVKENTPEVKEIESKLRHHFATEIKVKTKNQKSGKIEIEFYSEDDFERLVEMLLNE